MKKLLFILSFLFLAVSAQASESVWKSSTTAASLGNGGQGSLCGSGKRGLLYSVVVSSAGGGTGGMMLIANSSWTTSNVYQTIGPINLATVGQYEYRVILSSGLVYTSTGTAVSTILYDCY